MITGTSLGEWSAAMAAGMIELDQIAAMSVYADGREIDDIKGAIGLTQCSIETLQPFLDDFNRGDVTVTCSMDLSPEQVVFAGTRDSVPEFCERLNQAGIWAECLNLFPIHTPLCKPVADLIYRRLEGLRVAPARVPAYSAATTEPFPEDAEKMRTLLADNAILPVHMRLLFTKLYDEGARIFVQLGGGGKIETPIRETLGDRPHAIFPLDVANRHPLHQLQHVIASLYAHHTPIKTDLLYDYRSRHLNRSAEEKSKRAEFVVNLSTTIPKFQVKNERLDLAQKQKPSETAACSKSDSVSDVRSKQNAGPCPSEWEELLCEQMNTMTRMYALQKEDDLTEMAHFTNMLQCQAQLLEAPSGTSPPSAGADFADRLPENAFGRAEGRASFTNSATAGCPARKHVFETHATRLSEALPFVDEIEAYTANQMVIIRRKLSLASDLFLMDHAFIPCPADIKPQEEKLPTLPMAVALEIISEAAQSLFPAKTVWSLKHIRNKRWINLTERVREKELIVTARINTSKPSNGIEVDCTIAVASDEREICFTGTVLLADGLYTGDPHLCIEAENEATRRFDPFDPKALYRPGGLYHGACFQGLEKLFEISDAGVDALLSVPSANGFFDERSGDAMILPVQAIDIASQLICCYDLAMHTRNNWVAPVSIERILRCKPSPAPGAQVRSKLMIRGNDSNLVAFDMLLEANGEIFMVILGWRDWRMKWSDRLLASWQNPSVNLLAGIKKQPSNRSIGDDPIYGIEPGDLSGIDPDWLARLYLNASEYETWRRLPLENRIEWLTRLIAVKDLFRGTLQRDNIFIYPSQVATKQLSEERFSVQLSGGESNRSRPFSIQTAKQNDATVAMAVPEPSHDMHLSFTDKGGS
jgi:malonyl CoA-acyl carrier protein transacylase